MPGPSGISGKSIGFIAAAILTLIFFVVIWISMANSAAPTNINPDLFPADHEEIPNVEETQHGGAMFVTMVDKNDPTRIAGTLKADRFEPMGEGRRRLDNPESWIYIKDGRAVKITADFATMLMPDPNQPPESGTLEGNIRIEAFDSTPSPGSPPLDDADPMMVAQFVEPVEFERRYLRLRSPGHFEIESDQFDFSGSDLTVILNELRDRVELIDVIHGDQLVIHTDAQTKNSGNSTSMLAPESNDPSELPAQDAAQDNSNAQAINSTIASNTEQAKPQASTQSEANTINRYHIALNDDVNATVTGSGEATADLLELWVALEGGTLPADAIKAIGFAQREPSSPTTAHSPTNPPATTPQPLTPATTATHSTTSEHSQSPTPAANDIVIKWSGKMTVRPIDDVIPPQLAQDSLTLKLASQENNGITFNVPDRDFLGQAFSATYHATRGVVALDSVQTEAGIIKLESAQTGSVIATALNANLGTGIVDFLGRGQITSTPDGPSVKESQAEIQWKNAASFTLMMIDNEISDRLTSAHFEGTVMGNQEGNTVGARSLDAKFDPSLPPANSLKKLTMVDGVLSSSSRSILSGSSLAIDFIPGSSGSAGNSVEPVRLEADGQVLGRNTESMLKTDHLVVTMYRDLAGDMIVRTADAQGNIKYTGADRTTANGDTLTADGVNETMTLMGSPANVAQGGSKIVGDHINMNARRRGIEVLGPGSFDHDIALDDSNLGAKPAGHIRATWKGEMRFDDAIGSIICEDQVRVVSTPDAYTRDTLDAHRAEIKLTPIPTADPIADRSKPNADRELIFARMFGHAPAGQDPIAAKIESRTYAQDDPERVIGLIYLEGSQILANNQNQTLDVPAPGTLLVLDRTDDDETGTNTSTSIAATGPGLTKFTWQGRMNLNRALGTANFIDQVLVRQKTISTGKVASLSTDQLDARFDLGEQDQEQGTRLLSASATGTVRFIYEQRELLADSAIYDAIEDSLFASAIDNKLVTLYDETQPAPMSAKTMKWDLTRDRIEINTPTPTRSTGG
jgi:hypothetical protein